MSGKPIVKERQPDAPKCSETPLESLEPKPYDTKNPYSDFEPYFVVGFALGVGGGMYTNFFQVRPLFSGIPRLLFFGICTGIGFKAFDWVREKRHRERDAMMREYILMHPEQFPPYERIKYRDIFEPWNPTR